MMMKMLNNPTGRWHHAVLLLVIVLSIIYPVISELSDTDQSLFDALQEEDLDGASAALKAGANINSVSPRGKS